MFKDSFSTCSNFISAVMLNAVKNPPKVTKVFRRCFDYAQHDRDSDF